jgi:hypothetical protein
MALGAGAANVLIGWSRTAATLPCTYASVSERTLRCRLSWETVTRTGDRRPSKEASLVCRTRCRSFSGSWMGWRGSSQEPNNGRLSAPTRRWARVWRRAEFCDTNRAANRDRRTWHETSQPAAAPCERWREFRDVGERTKNKPSIQRNETVRWTARASLT